MSETPRVLPDGLIADTMNSRGRRTERGFIDHDAIPRLHVSSLIKSSPADFFCAREFVLKHMERRTTLGGSVPPKFALLWAAGHFYGEYIVNEFLRRNPDYAGYAWGDWRCVCKETRINQVTYDEVRDSKCPRCRGHLNNYVETDLFNPEKTVVGHADLIIKMDNRFYVYEFKSIDRADIDFDTLAEPLGDHVLQASNYYYMLKAQGYQVSSRLRFVYIDRSMLGLYTQDPFREFYMAAAKASRLDAIYKRAKLCHSSISKGTLPQRRCATIDCTRAKQCSVAVSCFNRTLGTIRRLPLDLILPSVPLASTASPSTTKNGMASRLKPNPRTAQTRPVSARSAKK